MKKLSDLRLAKYPKAEVDAAIRYKSDGTLPAGITGYAARKLRRKYRPFEVEVDQLVHKDVSGQEGEGAVIRVVIPAEEIDETLKSLMLDIKTANYSRDSLYYYCQSKYIGISQADCMEWLRNREWYQLQTKQKQSLVKTPIISAGPNDRWQCDFTEPIITSWDEDKKAVLAKHNKGYRYIFTLCDHFSRFLWATPTKSRAQAEYIPILKEIIKKDGAPTILQADNEFRDSGELGKLAEKYGFEIRNSESYHPSTNGMIERLNGILKQRIAQFFVTYSTDGWADHLADLVENYNNTRQSVTKRTPREVYFSKDSKVVKDVARKNWKRVLKIKKTLPKLPPLKIGDTVRASHNPEHLTFRNKVLKVHWSTELYTVTAAHTTLGQNFYDIRGKDGEVRKRRYPRDELLKIDPSKLDRTNYDAD